MNGWAPEMIRREDHQLVRSIGMALSGRRPRRLS